MPTKAPVSSGHTFASSDTLTAALLNKAFSQAQAEVPDIPVAAGGTGATSAQAAQKNLSCMGYLAGWVEYTDETVEVSLGTLPAYAVITQINVLVWESFNGSGTDTIAVGIPGTENEFGAITDILGSAQNTTLSLKATTMKTAATTVIAYYNASTADASQGKALVVVQYAQVPEVP